MSDSKQNIDKFLPDWLLRSTKDKIPGLRKAFGSSLCETESSLQAMIDQLFLTTAQGRFLVEGAASKGLTLPADAGVDIEGLRDIAPVSIFAPKQIKISLEKIIEAFYGLDVLAPSVSASTEGPYKLKVGDSLTTETPRGIESVVVGEGDFSNLDAVTSAELASFVTANKNGVSAFVSEATGGLSVIKITATTKGLSSFVRIVGGTIQNQVKFQGDIPIDDTSLFITYDVSKESLPTDVVRIEKTGPSSEGFFNVQPGDSIILRCLEGNTTPLEGSYVIINSGVDFVEFRSRVFPFVSETIEVTPFNDVSVSFLSKKRFKLTDLSEYASVSEFANNSVTITLPAVPPVTKRGLKGSTYLTENKYSISEFTRTSVSITATEDQVLPQAGDQFVLRTDTQRPSLDKIYKILSVSGATPNFTLALDSSRNLFPQINATSLPENPVSATVGSDEIVLEFNEPHELVIGAEISLAGLTGSENITPPILNDSLIVSKVNSTTSVSLRIDESFDGVNWGVADIYRHPQLQSTGADFYIEFASAGDLAASGLNTGSTFQIDGNAGVSTNLLLSNFLRAGTFEVVSISANRVDFIAGIGSGSAGLVIGAATGERSDQFGGNLGTWLLDQNLDQNDDCVYPNAEVILISEGRRASESFVGPYLYDPTGTQGEFTVSNIQGTLSTEIIQGSAPGLVFLDTDNTFPGEGEVIFAFGTSRIEGPVAYSAFVDQGQKQLLIDPSFVFENNHEEGVTVLLVAANTAYKPSADVSEFASFLTDTTQVRNTLVALLSEIIAAGKFININVLLPQLTNSDPALTPYS